MNRKVKIWCTVRAPVFGRHQFFGTSEHYVKAHESLLSDWMNYNYTACCWFPTSSNISIHQSQFWQIRFESDFTVPSAEYWCSYGTCKLDKKFKEDMDEIGNFHNFQQNISWTFSMNIWKWVSLSLFIYNNSIYFYKKIWIHTGNF